MDQKWYKKTYVCNQCDAMLEITTKSDELRDRTCLECYGSITLLSVEDATINNNNKKEEVPPMNATTSFLETRVEALEEQLKSHQNCDYWKSELGRIQRQMIDTINDGYEGDKDATEILKEMSEIIDYNPVKTIEFTATMSFSGSIDIPMDEVDSFDLEQALEDAYVDINNGNVVIENQELYDANEC